MPRHYQTLADYAAIGIAPLLIWWMLNSLANFLMIVIYHGHYSWHVSWIWMCYTMGATALARLTIEESRERASAYAVALGAATFYVMLQYVHDPIFLLAIILTIGYLADRIVHDCTIIDDGVDSSGQGLVDSVRKWFQKRSPPSVLANETTGWQPRRAKKNAGHQPGKTVLYLAVGALPLFGIGQFFLDRFPGSWERAKWMLTLYLFTSLSLLVVTSFLNLRRYLRQRGTEMTAQVTVAWLAGGVGMILLILMIAYLAPLPGQTLLSFQMPDFLSDSHSTKASKLGFGGDGASESDKDSRATGDPRADAQEPEGAPEKDSRNQPDAKLGGDSGNKKDGPAGQEKGGNKPTQQTNSSDKPGKSEQSPKPSGAEKSPKSAQPESNNADKPNDPSSPDTSEKSEQAKQQQKSDNQSPPPNESDSRKQDASKNDGKPDSPDQKPDENKTSPSDSAESKPAEPKASRSNPISQLNNQIAGLFKYILIAGLIALIAIYIYLYRDAWLEWLNNWLNSRDNTQPATPSRRKRKLDGPPARPFSSFANPVGTAEAGQVVVVTFQALEAWGREQGVQRGDDETPSEYVRRLAAQFPTLKQPAWRVVDAYNRVVYGRTPANGSDVNAASSVWRIMRPQL